GLSCFTARRPVRATVLTQRAQRIRAATVKERSSPQPPSRRSIPGDSHAWLYPTTRAPPHPPTNPAKAGEAPRKRLAARILPAQLPQSRQILRRRRLDRLLILILQQHIPLVSAGREQLHHPIPVAVLTPPVFVVN